jgi:hypothetical protein
MVGYVSGTFTLDVDVYYASQLVSEYIYPRCGEVLCAPINITKIDLVIRSAEKSR